MFLDAMASIIWHELEHGGEVDCPRVGRFGVKPAARGRRDVAFHPATELEVAVNRQHITAQSAALSLDPPELFERVAVDGLELGEGRCGRAAGARAT